VVAQVVRRAPLLGPDEVLEFIGSRMKNTGVLFPTRSKLPSEV
jgi:hypothetical protein